MFNVTFHMQIHISLNGQITLERKLSLMRGRAADEKKKLRQCKENKMAAHTRQPKQSVHRACFCFFCWDRSGYIKIHMIAWSQGGCREEWDKSEEAEGSRDMKKWRKGCVPTRRCRLCFTIQITVCDYPQSLPVLSLLFPWLKVNTVASSLLIPSTGRGPNSRPRCCWASDLLHPH